MVGFAALNMCGRQIIQELVHLDGRKCLNFVKRLDLGSIAKGIDVIRCFYFWFLIKVLLGSNAFRFKGCSLRLNQQGVFILDVLKSFKNFVKSFTAFVFFQKFFRFLKMAVRVAQI